MTNKEQKHGLPALMSFFIPGLGQAVKGHIGKAAITFIAWIMSILAICFLIGFLLVPIVWVVGIYDAYNSNNPNPFVKE